MSSLATDAIGIAEAAYDLEAEEADWLSRVLEAGRQTLPDQNPMVVKDLAEVVAERLPPLDDSPS